MPVQKQKRKTHHKSRRGCRNCKDRHVKCDELGPPCANCVVRETTATCTFASAKTSRPAATATAAEANHSRLKSTPSSGSDVPDDNAPPDPSYGRDASPDVLSPQSRRLLELELMHRFTTVSYESMCCTPGDKHYSSVVFPQGGQKHAFVMDAVLACAAMEIAVTRPESASLELAVYVEEAVRYYERASAGFREVLYGEDAGITRDNMHLVYTVSCIIAGINMALPWVLRHLPGGGIGRHDDGGDEDHHSSPLATTVTIYELLWATTLMAAKHWDWLMEPPSGPYIRWMMAIVTQEIPPQALADATVQAFARMERIIDKVPEGGEKDGEELVVTQADLRKGSSVLYHCFQHDTKKEIGCYCISFPSHAGPRFLAGLKASHPVALFIVMHWAVLLHRRRTEYWWMRFMGKDLVIEISSLLAKMHPALVASSDWSAGIEWARDEVDVNAMDDVESK